MINYDINLIRTFTTLYETRSVTRAAERLFLTQPSVSYTLRRLRTIFDNELFVRQGREMAPTVVAEQLYPRLRDSLEVLDEIMQGEDEFAPATSRRTFRLQMTDVGTIILLKPVIRAITAEAPNVRIEVDSLRLSSAPEHLKEGKIDAFICTPRIVDADIRRDVLFPHNYVGICSIDHPRIGANPELAEYLQERHINLTSATGHRIVDDTLLDQGVTRTVTATVPNFLALPALLEGSEFISYAPLVIAKKFRDSGKLKLFELPIKLAPTEVSLHTYRRPIPSPATDWLRNIVRTSLTGIEVPVDNDRNEGEDSD